MRRIYVIVTSAMTFHVADWSKQNDGYAKAFERLGQLKSATYLFRPRPKKSSSGTTKIRADANTNAKV